MRTRTAFLVVAALLAVSTLICNLRASLVNLPTVTVGDPGNAADTTGYGAVAHEFNIGKYEVTISQYSAFLNSVASVTSDSYIVDLWNANMTSNLNIAGISRSGSGTLASPYSYSVIGSGDRPISYVSWFDAARFANWMNNGATNGAGTESGAYTLNGATNGIAVAKNQGATWWIPSQDEWYKAAFYKGGGTNAGYWLYPTQSDTLPTSEAMPPGFPNSANYDNVRDDGNKLTAVGAYTLSSSYYGTFDQAGNLSEWNDVTGAALLYRGLRGGNWGSMPVSVSSAGTVYFDPSAEQQAIGFRLASAVVPELATWTTAALLAASAAFARWRRKRR